MIRAEELMIGDWVRNDFGESQKVVELRESGAMLSYNDVYPYEELEQIPLTPEILEKNLKEFIPGLNCMYELGGPYCISLEQENCWVFGLATKAARYPMVKIRYVHELQHALRLCGIEKEIVV